MNDQRFNSNRKSWRRRHKRRRSVTRRDGGHGSAKANALNSPALSTTGAADLCELEQRILFSAAPLDIVELVAQEAPEPGFAQELFPPDLADNTPLVTIDIEGNAGQFAELTEDELSDAQELTNSNSGLREIVFIDGQVTNRSELLAALQSGADRQFEVVLLDSARDGIMQISEALQNYRGLNAIHLISHGDAGQISLGNFALTLDSLSSRTAELAAWNQALHPGADLLIYGCNVADGADGKALLQSLSELCGCDVAASSDLTGHERAGGDWDLEFRIGDVVASGTFQLDVLQQWSGTLAIINVTTFADVVNASDGVVSLREAINQANAGAGGDTIVLAAGTYQLSISGGDDSNARGDFDILRSVNIDGAGTAATIIDAGFLATPDRVFQVFSGANLAVNDLTIQRGDSVGNDGGAIHVRSGASAIADRVLFLNNNGDKGGAVYNDGVFSATYSTFANNSAKDGGAVFNKGGELTFTNVAFTGNSAANDGGALRNEDIANLNSVEFSGNSADRGGAIHNSSNDAAMNLVNVTISGNSAVDRGGGIYTSENVNATNVTIAFNSANNLSLDGEGGGVFATGGDGDVTLLNSIVYNNTANIGANSNRELTTLGHNIADATTIAPASRLTGDADVDPQLNPLLDFHGGFTRSHSIAFSSPARNGGTTAGAPAFDQRGQLRDGSPDIGAFEFAANVLTVDTAADYGPTDARWGNTTSITTLLADRGSDNRISLREAIEATNNTVNGGTPDVIHFNIPDGSTGQYYYRFDGVANSVSLANITAAPLGGEAAILNFDPDHPYSWFRINLGNSLPQLTVTDTVIIDAYTQWGAAANSLSIGTDAIMRIELTNTAADANRGITFATGANGSVLRGMTINRFGGLGVLADYDVHQITVHGNYIGTDITGTCDLGNAGGGIQLRSSDNLVGGPDPEHRNVISGNDNSGVILFSGGTITGNVIQNNYIGTDSSGLVALQNIDYGIQLYNDRGTRVVNNVISGNETYGIFFRDGAETHNAVVQGNLIGVGADSTTVVANGADGIRLQSDAATGNRIGGTGAGEGNVIAGNTAHGIRFDGSGITDNFVYGNYIGTDASGSLALGNGGSGVLMMAGASRQIIGGIGTGEGNTIAFNALDGVAVPGGTRNSIRGNRFYGNGDLAIDLIGNNGVNNNDPNDPDSGSNDLQNFPVVNTAMVAGSSITINATLNSTPSTAGFVVDFYWSPTADSSGHGEARHYIGSVTVGTNVSGNATISHTFNPAIAVPANAFVTATATDAQGNTSEFAANVMCGVGPVLVNNQLTINEGAVLALSPAHFNATDADDTPGSLVYTVSGVTGGWFALAGSPTVPITSFTQAQINSGSVVFVDDGDENAPTSTVAVSDGTRTVGPANTTINFTNVNDPPVVSGPVVAGTTEDDASFGVNLLAGASDVDGGPLNVTGMTLTGGDASGITVSGNSMTVDPSAYNWLAVGQSETITWSYTISDGNGGNVAQTATITITGANDAPVVSGPVTTNAFDFDPPCSISLLSGASDPDLLDLLSISGLTLVSGNAGGISVSGSSLNIDPSFYAWLGAGQSEVITWSYTITDGNGGSTSQTATITIAGVNDAPLVTDHRYTGVTDGAPITGNVLAGSSDIDGGATSAVLYRYPATGALVLNPDGTFVYMAPAGFSGTVTFEFVAFDGHDNSNPATVTINVLLPAPPPVEPVNDEPQDEEDTDQPEVLLPRPGDVHHTNSAPEGEKESLISGNAVPARLASVEAAVDHDRDPMGIESSTDFYRIPHERTPLVTSDVTPLNVELAINPMLLASLQTFDEQMDEAMSRTTLVWVSSMVSLSGLSIGVVSWILRSGALLTSLIAQMPAWRIIDPLVVLGYSGDDDECEESVEDIIDAGEQPATTGENNTPSGSPSAHRTGESRP